jgi:hypothetical protein
MKKTGDRPLAGIIVLMAATGIGLLALLVLAPDYAQAGLNGAKPVSVQSALQADYSAGPLDQRIQPIDARVVRQVLADQAESTQPAAAWAATLSNRLMTPVATITPSGPTRTPAAVTVTQPPVKSSTPAPNTTSRSTPEPLPTRTLEATTTRTLNPIAATLTARPTFTPTRTLNPTLAAKLTNTVPAGPPTATLRPTFTATPNTNFITAIVATRTALPTATRIPPTLPAYPPPHPTATSVNVIKTPTAKPYP